MKTLNVVMIATEKPSTLSILDNKSLHYKFRPFRPNSFEIENQHLYFTSDDEIKTGDWVLCAGANGDGPITVIKYTGKELGVAKIEATTNNELKLYEAETIAIAFGFSKKTNDIVLLQIPLYFVEFYINLYNEGRPISKVDVEIEEIFNFNIGDKLLIKNSVYGYKEGDYITVKNFNHKNENKLISFVEDDENQMGFNLGHLVYTTTNKIKINSANEVSVIKVN